MQSKISKITSLAFIELAAPKSATRQRGDKMDARILICGHECGTLSFFTNEGKLLFSPLLHNTTVLQIKPKCHPNFS